MFRTFLLIALRGLRRQKAFSLLNILGLAVGVAASVLIFLVIRYETGYDSYQSKKDRVYRVVTNMVNRSNGEVVQQRGNAPLGLADVIRPEIPGVEKAAAVLKTVNSQVYIGGKGSPDEKRFLQKNVFFAEPELFDLLDFQWLDGNATLLKDPFTVVLAESQANQYFGSWKAAVGKTIEFWSFRIPLRVVGVFHDLPGNTDLPLQLVPSYATIRAQYPDWFTDDDRWHFQVTASELFVLLSPGQSRQRVEEGLTGIVTKYYNEDKGDYLTHTRLSLQPLPDLHLNEHYKTYSMDALSKKTLWSLGLIGLFLLVIACINFINLSTAQSVNRAKEIGVRKVLGSSRYQLLRQFLTETALITLLAVGFGCLLAQGALPFLQGVMGKDVEADWLRSPSLLFFLLLSGTGIVFLAGYYPALVQSDFNPIKALKSKINTRTIGGFSLRRGLVVVQFVMAQLLIVGTIVVVRQTLYFRNRPLGFDKAAVMMIGLPSDSTDKSRYEHLKTVLNSVPGVEASSLCREAPAGGIKHDYPWYYDNSPVKKDYTVSTQFGDGDYLKALNIGLAAGRAADTGRQELLVNETLVHKLGLRSLTEILGKTIALSDTSWRWTVVGVIKDYNSLSLREAIPPMVVAPDRNSYNYIAVRMAPGTVKETMVQVQQAFAGVYPNYLFESSWLDEQIAQFYQSEEVTATLVKVFASLALFISCLGLYGLVSFMTVQKTKEVGIRKVLGAPVWSILALFSREFTVLPGLAFLVAAPVGWMVMNFWLSGFYYHITLGWGEFGLTLLLSLVVAWGTVGYKAWKAASVNPVKSLRAE
jgi:predicted permease